MFPSFFVAFASEDPAFGGQAPVSTEIPPSAEPANVQECEGENPDLQASPSEEAVDQ